jgi:rod shape determining protein RodA
MARGVLLRSSETIVPEPIFPADRRALLSLTRLGWGLALPVLLLMGIGLACIHATEGSAAAELANSPDTMRGLIQPSEMAVDEDWVETLARQVGTNTAKQIVFIVSGLGLMVLALIPSYQRIGRFAYAAYAGVLGLLLLLMIDRYVFNIPDFIVPVRQNARRWVTFGGAFGIQPSEFMKLALVLALARYLRYRDSYRTWRGLIAPLALAIVPAVMILKQPNLGTCMLLMPVLFAMLFMAGARVRHLLTVVGVGALLMPAFYFFGMQEYQRDRVLVVLNQNSDDESWHKAQGYQLRVGKIALATGGVWGRGYGQGEFVGGGLTLPEGHNDFIFSIVGHQFGLVGCLVVIGCYIAIVFFGLEVASATNDPFGKLVAVGVVVMIVVQAFFNMATNLGLAPITGVQLPFVSAGGSSLWANMIALGLLINVAQRRPLLIAQPPFVHKE